ncbi:MAG TPA: radical SAM/SPASM domain-containing protein [Campylobacterales bacterium]|nr:radical SAM/SPASM domain-containing protein [Campylobacterales bacterium]
MKFYRIYIELTNICGLTCSFCPTKNLPSHTMDLNFFEDVIKQASLFTKEIACHVVGDPLTLSNLDAYLSLMQKYNLKAVLTTSGYYLKNQKFETLFSPPVKQINISLNSYNKNDSNIIFEKYMQTILEFCSYKIKNKKEQFINLRVWNLDEQISEKAYNKNLFELLSSYFDVKLDEEEIYTNKPKTIRLSSKILLHFDNYFQWPTLDNKIYGDGTCQGLQSHIAILASGEVVPCCLDCDGVIKLGNLHDSTLEKILHDNRAKNILNGFKNSKAIEELCQKCSYKDRFN